MAISCQPSDLVTAAKCFSCIPKSARRWVKVYLLCQYGVKVAGISPVALDWVNRVVANGGAVPSQNTINAVSSFIQTLQANSLDSMMTYVLMFAPDSLIAALTPLYRQIGNSNDPAANTGFVVADLNTSGLIGTLAKWLDSGVIPSSAPWYNAGSPPNSLGGMSCVVTNGAPVVSDSLMGCTNATGATAIDMLYANNPPEQIWCYMWNNGASGFLNPSAPNVSTYLSVNRAVINQANLFAADSVNGFRTLQTNNNASISGPGGLKMAILGQNNNGTFGGTTRRFSFGAIHTGLTSAQSQTLYNAVQALRTAFGGGFT